MVKDIYDKYVDFLFIMDFVILFFFFESIYVEVICWISLVEML